MQPKRSLQNPNHRYSQDGYIRLTFQCFCALPFDERMNFSDDELRNDLRCLNLPVAEAGYCEWLYRSDSVQISVGWAWFVAMTDTQRRLAPGGISSNVMMTSTDGSDLGTARTHELLTHWLSTCAWQEQCVIAPPVHIYASIH